MLRQNNFTSSTKSCLLICSLSEINVSGHTPKIFLPYVHRGASATRSRMSCLLEARSRQRRAGESVNVVELYVWRDRKLFLPSAIFNSRTCPSPSSASPTTPICRSIFWFPSLLALEHAVQLSLRQSGLLYSCKGPDVRPVCPPSHAIKRRLSSAYGQHDVTLHQRMISLLTVLFSSIATRILPLRRPPLRTPL